MAAPGSAVRYRSWISSYDKGAKQLALNVFGTLRKEGGKSSSLSSLIKRTAAFTNVTERALYKWAEEHDKHGEVLSPKTLCRGGRGRDREQLLDDFDIGVSRRVMHGFCKRWEIPTARKLAAYFKDDSLPSVFATTIHSMPLRHCPCWPEDEASCRRDATTKEDNRDGVFLEESAAATADRPAN
ncbi:hypothetical protein HPB51_009368 [Rhipicephalus microplus]|uniref:Uncharacterized protein n=1 Tax=Rhipicephalus microplus TaxID=6941 RepID=A0A9J6F1V7_RHIMP|nr:hypothetical protein HPB51_009368 [Rhipicephalus microplus]